MALTRICFTTTAGRLVPIGLALFSILLAACNNGGGGGTGY